MRVSGTGITTFQAHLKQKFRVRTQLALQWMQTSSGNWYATDRGASSDIYECEVELNNIRGTVEQFVEEINNNRAADSHVLTLDWFEDNEHIFGEDIDHSGSISATVIGDIKIDQMNWKVYGCKAILRALSPSNIGSASFPVLKYLNRGYNANVDGYTVSKYDTFDGTFSYLDMKADSGVFEGEFLFTQTELQGLRRWIATNRGSQTTIATIYGVTNPWGPLRGGYSITAKPMELVEREPWGMTHWLANLKLVEVV